MKNIGAKSILVTMMLGVLGFLGHLVFANAQAVAVLKIKEQSSKEMIKEIKSDVKWLRNNVKLRQ